MESEDEMHIPENYLSPQTCGVMAAAMVPVWTLAIRKVKTEIPREKLPLLGIGAAFSFVSMMFNVPIPGGTTGHAVGGTLIAILLGPDAACLSVSIALLIQALLFGDGGVLAFGANCFNMAFVLPYLGYAIYRALSKTIKGEKGKYIAAAIASYVGINASAFFAAVEFGIQPMLFRAADGQALYCPYGLGISIPMMMIGHLTIFGLAEVIFTTAVFAFVNRVSGTEEGQAVTEAQKGKAPVLILLGTLIALTPLGLLATGSAWGEWGADEIAEVVTNGTALGYTPFGLANGWEWTSFLPDYSFRGLPDAAGYILSAVIGTALCLILFRIFAGSGKKADYSGNAA